MNPESYSFTLVALSIMTNDTVVCSAYVAPCGKLCFRQCRYCDVILFLQLVLGSVAVELEDFQCCQRGVSGVVLIPENNIT